MKINFNFFYFAHSSENTDEVYLNHIDLSTFDKNNLYTFDATWLEPYLKVFSPEENYRERSGKVNEVGLSSVNLKYQIERTIAYDDGSLLLVLRKYMPIIYTARRGESVVIYDWEYSGDVVFLQLNANGEVVSTEKINRSTFFRRTQPEIMYSLQGEKLVMFYYSQDLTSINADSPNSETHINDLPDDQIFYTIFNLSTNELQSSNFSLTTSGQVLSGYRIYFNTACESGRGILVYAKPRAGHTPCMTWIDLSKVLE